MSEMNAILLLFDRLTAVGAQPAQIPELLDYLQSALDRDRVTAEVGDDARRILTYDPSDLFVTLHELEREGLVAREPMGYSVTEEGHHHAEELRANLPSEVIREIELAANAA